MDTRGVGRALIDLGAAVQRLGQAMLTETPAPDVDASRLLPLAEIAELSGVSVETLRWLRHTGRGPHTFKVGRRVVATKEDVQAWINTMREDESHEPPFPARAVGTSTTDPI